MFDYVIVTHIPAFYKINLYNELAEELKILVVFIASNTNEKRADDFIALQNIAFEYKLLYNGNFQDRSVKENIFKLKNILKNIEYKKLIVSGWDLKEFWYLIFTNAKSKNCLALESTINESTIDGVRGFIKKIFLSRVSTVFASGRLHVKLLDVLHYEDKIMITKGVGIINKPKFEVIQRHYQKRFLYIGRLSKEKNIESLINIFNELPDYKLTIIGTGPLEAELKSKAKQNIIFEGQIENKNLKMYFLTNDIFILPSQTETWGLVVEEALYFGMPVMVSKNCGASELIENGTNGYILDIENLENIKKLLVSMDDKNYQKLLNGVGKYSIDEKDKMQVKIYQ